MNIYPAPGGTVRTSPRQAIVVDATALTSPGALNPGWADVSVADELGRAVFLDLLGSLVGVNGTTISVLAADQVHADALAALIPPGIDVITPPPSLLEGVGAEVWVLERHLQRAFSHVVAIAADVVALPTRTVATALSVLATADVVIGPAGPHRLFLLGVRDELGLAVIANTGTPAGFSALTQDAVRSAATRHEATIRAVERRRRLVDAGDLAVLRDAVAASPVSAPRTAALLRRLDAGGTATAHLHRDGASDQLLSP